MSPEPHTLILTYGRRGTITCAEMSEEEERAGDTHAHTTSATFQYSIYLFSILHAIKLNVYLHKVTS